MDPTEHPVHVVPADQDVLSDVVEEEHSGAWRRAARISVLCAFLVLIVAGLVGVYDIEGKTTGSAGNLEVTMERPLTGRAGRDVQLILDLSSSSALEGPVDVEIDRDGLELFDDVSFSPEPESQTAVSDDKIRLHYEVPRGSHQVELTLQGAIASEWIPRTQWDVTVRAQDEPPVTLSSTTWRLP